MNVVIGYKEALGKRSKNVRILTTQNSLRLSFPFQNFRNECDKCMIVNLVLDFK